MVKENINLSFDSIIKNVRENEFYMRSRIKAAQQSLSTGFQSNRRQGEMRD